MLVFTDPEFEFKKPLQDSDCYEKETGVMECKVNDSDAKVQWYREETVRT